MITSHSKPAGPAKALDVIRLWHVLEYLSPFDLQRTLTESLRYFPLVEGCGGRELPWSNPLKLGALGLASSRDYRYTIYFGVFRTEAAMRELRRIFEAAPPSFSDPPSEFTCFGSFTVGADGYPAPDTLSLSSLPWAVGYLRGDDLHAKIRDTQWAESFGSYRAEVYRHFFENADLLERVRRAFDAALLAELCDVAAAAANFSPGFTPLAYCIIEEDRSAKRAALDGVATDEETTEPLAHAAPDVLKEEAAEKVVAGDDAQADDGAQVESAILNSFYVQDLGRVFRALERGDVGVALARYLDEAPPADRTNLFDRGNLAPWCAPELLPPGRWPSADDKYQSLMQQVAINITRRAPKGVGLFSVNGPPGTGKTTMLRDVIADIVVERAARLAEFDSPWRAFVRGGEVSTASGRSFRLYTPSPRLTGFEIVVASSNNGAVENVTREIPGLEAVGKAHRPSAAYFGEVARYCLKADDSSEMPWGLIAAVLGNRRNLYDFSQKFWFDEDNKKQAVPRGRPRPMTFKIHLNERASTTQAEWSQAKNAFEAAQRRVETEIKRRQCWSTAVADNAAVEAELPRAGARHKAAEREYDEAAGALRKAALAVKESKEERADQVEDIKAIERDKPHSLFFFIHSLQRIFPVRKVERYEARMRKAQDELDEIKMLLRRRKAALACAQERLEECRVLRDEAAETLSRLRSRRERSSRVMNEGRLLLDAAAFAEAGWWSRGEREVQLRAPWLDANLNKARAELFFAALDLHQTFIEVARDRFRLNISLWADMVRGRLTCKPEEALALWQTFFLVVPVVSTTFASFGRMFALLGRESLGWLLIDEAGQAIPQAAVGALWRSKRSLVVGDPLQIEPVVALEDGVIDRIAEHFGLSRHWRPSSQRSGASVQKIADHVNPHGGVIGKGPAALWVGCPLRIHRRCSNPMFAISNTVAYEEVMIKESEEAPAGGHPHLGKSGWISIGGSCQGKHWVPEQGRRVLDMLAKLKSDDGRLPNVFVISPFRNVAYRLSRMLEGEEHRWVSKGVQRREVKRWLNESIGTVHTFQGKEAPIVIFILGTDHASSGAREWATSKPNILNVASTRAQQYLYVVGDGQLWGGLPYFSVARERLRRFTEYDQ